MVCSKNILEVDILHTVCNWWKYQFELEMPNSLLYHLKKIAPIGRAEHVKSSYTLSEMSAGDDPFWCRISKI